MIKECSRCPDYYGDICHFCHNDFTKDEPVEAPKEVIVATKEVIDAVIANSLS